MLFNIFIHIIVLIFFIIVPIGYGFFFKQLILKNSDLSIGELGIFGFLFIFFLTQLIHIFFPINYTVSLIFFTVGTSLFLLEIKTKIKEIVSFSKSYLFIFLLILISSITINLHDDVYLYQLPKLNYFQSSKMIFGVISLNDFLGFNVGFYDIMSIFLLPNFKNQFIYLLPIVFLFYFILFLRNLLFFNKHLLINIFIYTIFFIILLRFSRSKEYGADIAVLCTLFMSQIYLLQYLFEKKKIYIFKSILIIPFSIFLKVYAIFASLFFLIFIFYEKSLKIFIENKKIFIFIFLLSIITFGKNIVQTGCLFYPVSATCIDQNIAKWSIGKELSKVRSEYLEASTKGLKAYIRNNDYKYIEPKEFLKQNKYSYIKNILSDKDSERIFVVLLIVLILYLQVIKKKPNSESINNLIKNRLLLSLSSLIFVLWFIKIPHLRYGGYNYIVFFIFCCLTYFDLFKYFNQKNLNITLLFCCIFFLSKNTLRIQNEIINKNQNYPLIKYKKFKYNQFNKNNFLINYPIDSLYCGNIKFICTSSLKMIDKIYLKNSYVFIIPNNLGVKNFFDETEKSEAYDLNY